MNSKLMELTKSQVLQVEEDTQFVLVFPDRNSAEELTVEFVFEQPGVSAEIIGLYKLHPHEKLHLTTIANHKTVHTSCNTKIKGVLLDNASSTYLGKIIIAKEAQQTSSFLEDGVLVLGNNTHNRSDPILEIEADDVAASHGATTGRIDPDQVYYLQSRGLNNAEAEELIIEGYFESLLSQICDDSIREKAALLLK